MRYDFACMQAAAEVGNNLGSPGMSEWLKATISSLVGLVVGFVASPVTLWVKNLLDRQTARNALYGDLGRIYHILNRVLDLSPTSAEPTSEQGQQDRVRAKGFIADGINLGTYNHYSTVQAAAFWSIPEAMSLKRIYDLISAVTASLNNAPWAATHQGIVAVFEQFNRFFDEGEIDQGKLMKCRAAHRKRTIERIAEYYAAEKGPLVRDSQASPHPKGHERIR